MWGGVYIGVGGEICPPLFIGRVRAFGFSLHVCLESSLTLSGSLCCILLDGEEGGQAISDTHTSTVVYNLWVSLE